MNGHRWPVRLRRTAMLALGSMPLLLMIGARFSYPAWLWGLMVFGMSTVCQWIPGRLRPWCGAAGALLMIGCAAVSLAKRSEMALWIGLIVAVGLLLYSMPMGGWSEKKELPSGLCGAFILGYMLAQVMLTVPGSDNNLYLSAKNGLLGCFLVFLALLLFRLNRHSLSDATARGKSVPQNMRQQNRLLTFGMLFLGLFIAGIPAIGRLLSKMWNMMIVTFLRVIAWFSSLFSETSIGGDAGGGASGLLPGAENAEPSLFVRLLEKAAAVLAFMAAAALFVLAIRKLWQKVRVLGIWLRKWLGRYMEAASEDYTDEVTDTRNDPQSASRRRLLRRRLPRVDENTLSPSQRIRWQYRRLLWRHSEWSVSSTARENLPAQAAQLYEQVRYSTMSTDAQMAQCFVEQTRELEKKA